MKINTDLILKLQSGGITVSQGVNWEAPERKYLSPDAFKPLDYEETKMDWKPLDDIKSDGYHTAAFETHVGTKIRALKNEWNSMDKFDKMFAGPEMARRMAEVTDATTFLNMKHQEDRTKRGLDQAKANESLQESAIVGDETWVQDAQGKVKKVDMGEFMLNKDKYNQITWEKFHQYWDEYGSHDLSSSENASIGYNYGGKKINEELRKAIASAGTESYKAVEESIQQDHDLLGLWMKTNRGTLDSRGLESHKTDFKRIDDLVDGVLQHDKVLYNSLMGQAAGMVSPFKADGTKKTKEDLRKEQYQIMREGLVKTMFGSSTEDKVWSSGISPEGTVLNPTSNGGGNDNKEKISFWTVATHPTNDISQLVDSFPSTIGDGAVPIRKISVPSTEMKPIQDMIKKEPTTHGSGDNKVVIDRKTAKELAVDSRGSFLLQNGQLLDQQWLQQNGGKFLMDAPTASVTHLPEDPAFIQPYIEGLKAKQKEMVEKAKANAIASKDKSVDLVKLEEFAKSQATDLYEKSWNGSPLMLYSTMYMVGQSGAVEKLNDFNTIMKGDSNVKEPIIDEFGTESLNMTKKGSPLNSLGISDNKSSYMKEQLNVMSDESFSYSYKVPVYVPVPNSFWNGDNTKNEWERHLRAEYSQNSQRVESMRKFMQYTGNSSWNYTEPK
jgi:hypothetical protein